jgi:hypothetical protein
VFEHQFPHLPNGYNDFQSHKAVLETSTLAPSDFPFSQPAQLCSLLGHHPGVYSTVGRDHSSLGSSSDCGLPSQKLAHGALSVNY